MLRNLTILFAAWFAASLSLAAETRVTILHFSDYHSHAVSFYAKGSADRGGIARAIRCLRLEKRKPDTLVFNGGDMMNAGSPAWSDKYRCAEWSWLNGIVDAMAFGNHDADYGPSDFDRCRSSIRYPILGGNVVGADGAPLFAPYEIFAAGGVRIGVFAVAGRDFTALVKPEKRPGTGVQFTDRDEAARAIVRTLREKERVNAVVLIGHAHREDDEALAREVPGIDVIFGTHSHIKQELVRIEGTKAWFISPSQYLTYISRVELTFDDGVLTSVGGGLVPVDSRMPADHRIARRVAKMQSALERDPKYRQLFVTIGSAASELSLDDQLGKETVLGDFVMDVVRRAVSADLALSTTSSFRQPIAPGKISLEDLRATLPYPNQILVYGFSGSEVAALLQRCVDKRGTDSFCQFAGMNVRLENGRVSLIESGGAAIDPARMYRVATTDYLAKVNPSYRDLFASKSAVESGREVRAEVRTFIEANSPVRATMDGRLSGE